jgi:predicted HAD superfamily hydrolase
LHFKKHKVVKSLLNFRVYLEGRKNLPKYVSFDVFDTLLYRCIEPPEEIHRRVCSILAQKLKTHSADQLFSLRNEIVFSLRKSALDLGFDSECKFNEIIHYWVKSIVGNFDNELINFIVKTELELENTALMPKPEALSLLQWINSKKIKCIAISDMYLSEANIREFLRKFNLEKYFISVFVSSEFGLCKGSGRIYEEVLQSLEIDPLEIVHIGDNKISDMWVPSKHGINGIYLREKHERFRRLKQSLSS